MGMWCAIERDHTQLRELQYTESQKHTTLVISIFNKHQGNLFNFGAHFGKLCPRLILVPVHVILLY